MNIKTNQLKETMTIKSILPKDELKAYNEFCYNSKNNCLTVTPTSEPINIRGSRSDSNWCIEAVGHDLKNNINFNAKCVFWTKKEALNFLKTGKHICSITKQKLYQII